MADTHVNRLRCTVSAVGSTPSVGLGAFTVSSAIAAIGSGGDFVTFTAAEGGKTFTMLMEENGAWELASGMAYTHSGTSLARGTTLASSNAGAAVAFTTGVILTNVASAAFGNKTEGLLSVFGDTEISVTGATTATIDRMHHCTGTSADYTVTLPAASGNAGRHIGLRMGSSTALTKLVTIDGNASETIDGATTRIMWAQESAILLCDGSNWFKIAGKSVPMMAKLSRNSNQTGIARSTWSAISFNTQDSGNSQMYDSGNGRITIVRSGEYICSGGAYFSGTGTTFGYFAVAQNALAPAPPQESFAQSSAVSAIAAGQALANVKAIVGDYINLVIYGDGTSGTLSTNYLGGCSFSAAEVPAW